MSIRSAREAIVRDAARSAQRGFRGGKTRDAEKPLLVLTKGDQYAERGSKPEGSRGKRRASRKGKRPNEYLFTGYSLYEKRGGKKRQKEKQRRRLSPPNESYLP